MGILEQTFTRDFLRMVNDGWSIGWHEANGGNLSYRLDRAERAYAKQHGKAGAWKQLDSSYRVPELAGDLLLISAAGSHFRSLTHSPKECCGIIEIDSKGAAYRHIWGFKGKGRPTSELPSHLLIQELKKEQSKDKSRVVYHAHPTNAIVFASICKNGADLTHRLWKSISEAAIVFPDGVGMLKWMVPGSLELGIETCRELIEHDAVVWSNHGVLACGETFDHAFGLVHTIDKAADVAIKTEMLKSGNASSLDTDDLIQMSNAYSLNLDLRDQNTLREDMPFRPSFGTVPINFV